MAKRVQFLSGPWPYHTTAHIPNQVVQLRESQSERSFGTRSRLCGGKPLNCVPNRVLKMRLTIVSFGKTAWQQRGAERRQIA